MSPTAPATTITPTLRPVASPDRAGCRRCRGPGLPEHRDPGIRASAG
jgi:hypothetical protein